MWELGVGRCLGLTIEHLTAHLVSCYRSRYGGTQQSITNCKPHNKPINCAHHKTHNPNYARHNCTRHDLQHNYTRHYTLHKAQHTTHGTTHYIWHNTPLHLTWQPLTLFVRRKWRRRCEAEGMRGHGGGGGCSGSCGGCSSQACWGAEPRKQGGDSTHVVVRVLLRGGAALCVCVHVCVCVCEYIRVPE